jgi:DNA-binding beta-propeller fold protein YncE
MPRGIRITRYPSCAVLSALLAVILIVAAGEKSVAQSLRNPYRMVESWAALAEGRQMGAVGDVMMDPDGEHVWAVVRCDATAPDRFGNECLDSELDSILKFNLAGEVVQSFGGGLFIWPHGIFIDSDGNVWVTDAVAAERTPSGTRGHQVVKFSPEGDILMTLGTPGQPGSDNDHFNSPSDVLVGNNGDIFVVDGHGTETNNRIMKFSSDGRFLHSWGKTGYGPGEFHGPHAIAMDVRGRLFVADRFNNRVELFDQDGNHLATWTQFGRPSGIYFDRNDRIYVADSESDDVQNPGWEMGIRIGDAETGWVDSFILFPWGDPRRIGGNGAEFMAVDGDGNIYAGEPRPRQLRKYVRVRP